MPTPTITTDAFLYQKGLDGGPVYDDVVATGTTQGTAAAVGPAEVIRVTQGATNTGIILPSVSGLDASGLIYVVNDGPNTIKVYPAAGEVINSGAANAAVTIASGAVGVFLRIPPHTGIIHGRSTIPTAAWASANLPVVT